MSDPRHSHRRFTTALLGTAFLAAAAVAGFTAARATGTPPPLSLPSVAHQAGFADLVATVKPAVVNIATTQKVKPQTGPQLAENGPMSDMLQQFLGPEAQRELQQQMERQSAQPLHALGSGFLIDPSGYIVTNNHVISDATDIQITLSNGAVYQARIVGRDDKTDLALLKIDAHKPLPYVAFGNSDREQVGDWVIAVGNPFGLGGSVTAGIVSGNNRNIDAGPYDDFIQIDAPINPGNSGGPVFDQSGRVIGIDTAIYSPSGGSVGIGFAIPSNVAERVVAELRAHGHITRGWLGVQMQAVTPALAEAVGLGGGGGVLVDKVTENSPAASAGLRQGDVVTSFDGKPVSAPRDLAFAVADTSAGRQVPVTVLRNGEPLTLQVRVGTEAAEKLASAAPGQPAGRLGLELAPLSSDQTSALGVPGGAVVASVKPGSLADQSGIEAGDIILGIGEHKIASPADAAGQIRAAENADRPALPLLVMRDGTTAYVPLQLGKG